MISAVSAMCSSDGITASIDFDKPFTGKIYSLNYAESNDCLYYNNIDRDTVLFSIPAHICGTKLQRTTRNVSCDLKSEQRHRGVAIATTNYFETMSWHRSHIIRGRK